MATTLGEIMTKKVVMVGMDDRLEKVRDIFERRPFHHLLVEDNGELVGVLSDRDLFKALSPFLATVSERPRDTFTLKKRAHQIMSRTLVTATAETTISEAAKKFIKYGVSCLPILSPDGKTVEGIVTLKDILKWVMKESDSSGRG